MKRCLALVLIGLFLASNACPMALKLNTPPKGITLRFKTIAIYDFLTKEKYGCEALEVLDIYGLTFNGGVASAFKDDIRYVGAIMYDLKQFSELAENLPPVKPIAWIVEQINRIPCVELEAGICGTYNPSENAIREWSVGGTLNIIKVQW